MSDRSEEITFNPSSLYDTRKGNEYSPLDNEWYRKHKIDSDIEIIRKTRDLMLSCVASLYQSTWCNFYDIRLETEICCEFEPRIFLGKTCECTLTRLSPHGDGFLHFLFSPPMAMYSWYSYARLLTPRYSFSLPHGDGFIQELCVCLFWGFKVALKQLRL